MSHVKVINHSITRIINEAKNIIVVTGAGISAESGIPVFRGPGGLWRSHKAVDLACLDAFQRNPGLVWEFYHYRREVAFKAQPNKAHLALAAYEKRCKQEGRIFNIITQNVDGLHFRAGSENVIEMHGALNKVRCTVCGVVSENSKQPLCPALAGKGDPNLKMEDSPKISTNELPKCSKCNGLLRPHIVWFGENLETKILKQIEKLTDQCDVCLVVGTSSVVYPAAGIALEVVRKKKRVIEFNIEETPASPAFDYLAGPCSQTVPSALGIDLKELS